MLVLNMNSKRQRRPNVRLWEVGDLPAAFTCGGVSHQRIKQRRWKVRNNELENNGNSGFPPQAQAQQFPHDFGFLEFGISATAEVATDMQSENKNPPNSNSLKLLVPPEISGGAQEDEEFSGSKAEPCFGSITRKSRLMKRRRRSPDSLFLDPWGSKLHLVGHDFTLKCESSGHETTWTNEEEEEGGCEMETAEPNFMLHSSNEHSDEAEIAFPLSATGEGDKAEETQEEYTIINGVGEWLEEIGFGKYAQLFEMHEVDEETLPLLTLDDLKEMGIFAVGVRRKLLNAIKRAKGSQFQI